MTNKLNINYIINNVMFTIDEHYKERTIPLGMKKYLYLITTGMIINYGDEYISDIYKAVLDTEYCQNTSYNVLNSNLYYENPVSNNYLDRSIIVKGSGNKWHYSIIWEEIDNSPIKTLEYLTCKLNYILFNLHKTISIKKQLEFKISPINSMFGLSANVEDNIIGSVLNTLQAEEIVKIILKMNVNVISNKEFRELILMFSNVDINTYQIEGFDILANLFRPLYKEDKLKGMIDSYNNLELIKKEFDMVLGKNTYKNTYKQLITINKLINTKDVGNYYEISNCFVNIRNNVINRYIKLKWAL